jgi:hypothetical protein
MYFVNKTYRGKSWFRLCFFQKDIDKGIEPCYNTITKYADISVDASASCKIYELSGNEATITLPSGVTWNEVSVLE